MLKGKEMKEKEKTWRTEKPGRIREVKVQQDSRGRAKAKLLYHFDVQGIKSCPFFLFYVVAALQFFRAVEKVRKPILIRRVLED